LSTVVFVAAKGRAGVNEAQGGGRHPLRGVGTWCRGRNINERFEFPVEGVSLGKRSHRRDFKRELASPTEVFSMAFGGPAKQASAEHEMIG
jgi:hypothetical protein